MTANSFEDTRTKDLVFDLHSDVVSHDIVRLDRGYEIPVHAPSMIHTGRSLLAVHGFAKVGGTEVCGDVYRSTDGGTKWKRRCHLPTYHCGSFFRIGTTVYLLYADFKYEKGTKIRKSENDGVDWSDPVVLYDKPLWDGNGAYALRQGYLYKAMDEKQGARSPSLPRVLKLDTNADPMERESWVFSSFPNFKFPPPKAVKDPQGTEARNNNEGNCVVGPDGNVWVIYRHYQRTTGMFNATVFFDDTNNTQRFRNVYEPDPAPGKENCYSDFPGGCSGFHIAHDGVSKKYIALSNPVTGETRYPNGKSLGIYRCMRNVLVMMESDDLKHWRIAKHLIKDDLQKDWEQSVQLSGFQQINFQINGDDLIWISRTAYDGSHNLHDANRITFHRLPNFRAYLNGDDEVAYYSFDDADHLGKDGCKQAGPGIDNGNKAIPVGVDAAQGRFGGAAAFNGKDSRLDVNYRLSTEFHRAKAVTIACWLNVEAMPGGDESVFVFECSIDKGDAALELGFAGQDIFMGGRSCRQDDYHNTNHHFPGTQKWCHVAAIYDFADKQNELYIDGMLAVKVPSLYKKDLLLRGIPAAKDVIGNRFAGLIDELHFYRKRLTPAEIMSLMKER